MTLLRKIVRFGWIPDLPDRRDYRMLASATRAPALDRVDLSPLCPPVYDQGAAASCTANAWAAAYQFDMVKQKEAHVFRPSRLFIYYCERAIEGAVDSDGGAMLRDGGKALAKWGACPEYEWPYDISQLTVKPTRACYDEALKHQSLAYWRVRQAEGDVEACLASGFPLVFGFTVYNSFMSDSVAKYGLVPMPNFSAETASGGHAVMLVGYDRSTRRFLVRNSWGADWGMGGYCTMPYDYVLDPDLADDFWTLRKVE